MRSCLLIAAAVLAALPPHLCRHNFVQRLHMDDGQVLIRVQVDNKTALETSFAGYRLLEIADRRTFVRAWFKGSEMIDCGFESEAEAIKNFLQDFYADGDGMNLCSPNDSCPVVREKVTKVIEGNEELPHDVANMMRNEILVEKCTQFHERGLSGSRRAKRELLFPGTNWCGSGNNAVVHDKNMQLGLHAAADHCCREHDNCRHYISPFSWKYSLFNYRFHTVSHCRCDERFRSCLKNAKTPTANMIGKLFFNIGKTKCFRFKREKVCKKRSWWGTCLKKGRVRKAFFKNGFPF